MPVTKHMHRGLDMLGHVVLIRSIMLRIDCLRKEIRSMDRAVVKRQRLTRSMCASASHVRNSTVSLAIAMRAKDRVGAAIEKERKEGRKEERGRVYIYI
jgi:hypothetical protein